MRKFNIFNTNNLWINLKGTGTGLQVLRYLFIHFQLALKRIMDNGDMELDIIANPKVTQNGESVIQVG